MLALTRRRVAVLACFAGIVLLAPANALGAVGDQLWAAQYAGAAGGTDSGTSVAVSPDGSKVFVTGFSKGSGTKNDFIVIAYNATTGARIWGKRYDGPAHLNDYPHGIALSPSGGTVYVTGESAGSNGRLQWATVAYSAATGAQRWVQRYAPTAKFNHFPTAIAVKGSRVFVTGASGATTNGAGAYDIVTIAYSASTGTRLWANRYKHTANEGVVATALAASPDGATVFATGNDAFINAAITTIAYDAATGTRKWVRRDATAGDYAHAIGVAPDGSRVYVAGRGWNDSIASDDYVTVAYSASTGSTVWLKRNDGGEALALAPSPDGTMVFVTGDSPFDDACPSLATTVAYAATDGAQQWAKTFTPPQPSTGCTGSGGDAIAVSPDSGQVFITGWEFGSATVAYGTSDGAQQWAKSYRQSGGNAIAVSPDNLRTFITGARSFSGHLDMVTIDYQAR
jgi:DNA-binding beta-propeller fold protein YncE